MRIRPKAKAIVAAVGTIATAVSTAFADNVVSAGEVGELVTVVIGTVATVLAVYRVSNEKNSDSVSSNRTDE